jgi:FkbM family methyltransferase
MTKEFKGHELKYKSRPEFWSTIEGWEPETFQVLERFLGQGKTFLDIGAWNGVLSVYADKLGATPYAVEADFVAFRELEEIFELNDISPSQSLYAAIMDQPGTTLIFNSVNGFGNSMSSVLDKEQNDASQLVNSVTLESLIDFWEIKPDLIKIDTEGAELLIIPSSVEILRKLNCPLYLSLHPYWYPNGYADVQKIEYSLSQVYDLDKAEKMVNNQILLLR